MYAVDTTSSWQSLEHSVCRHFSCTVKFVGLQLIFFHLFHHVLPSIFYGWGWTFFQLNGREQNFYSWGVHRSSCSLPSWHHNALVLTNLTTGQIIILRHRQNLWMGKSFRGTKSTFHLWELLVHTLLGSQMDAGGIAFKSSGSGKNTSSSITGRLMPVGLALKRILLFCWGIWVFISDTVVPLGDPLPSAASAVAMSLLGRVTVQRPMTAAACSGYSSAFWLWHWGNMSCGILPFTLGCVPAITAFKGRMPVNPLP